MAHAKTEYPAPANRWSTPFSRDNSSAPQSSMAPSARKITIASRPMPTTMPRGTISNGAFFACGRVRKPGAASSTQSAMTRLAAMVAAAAVAPAAIIAVIAAAPTRPPMLYSP